MGTYHTPPDAPQAMLASPVARVRPGGPLGGDTVSLNTGADLEHWIAETLLLHASDPGAPERAGFWVEATQ